MIVKDINGMYDDLFLKAENILSEKEGTAISISNLNDYFERLKDLAILDPEFLILPKDEEMFIIDANTRNITIPKSFSEGIGVQGDEIAEIIYFTIDRYYDITDLYEKDILIQWKNGTIEGLSEAFNKTLIGDIGSQKVVFGWPISSEITENSGKILFSIKFYSKDANNDITYSFNTLTTTVKINPSLPSNLLDKIDPINKKDQILNNIKGYLKGADN